MKIPTITGLIERRILINYQIDAQVLEKYLPKPFHPKIVKEKGIAGICLIRLKEVRPTGFPKFIGVSSENGAHRIAVEWTDKEGVMREGVFIPRRDTSSKLNSWAGNKVFSGVHYLANFDVKEENNHYQVSFISKDETSLSIKAKPTHNWNSESVFESIEEASDFFEQGRLGYSPIPNKDCFDGLELQTDNWKVHPLEVENVHSSFFEDVSIFPKGSIKFDNALLMKNIEHKWIGKKAIKSR
ncbi:DUF2071 domain-containing protein [Bernardetia sp.]|uniref:DUF2071 domain-containing protein n=1 Tax=Bernardetia sp. TaxID=1937974 RepID=UPI0025C08ED2|nr:DUF2071 domain-containing protein [Bernardetia sp.]